MVVGSCPQMSSLSDRRMRLGDVLLPPEKTSVLITAVARISYIAHRVLMQLYVPLILRFGWVRNLIPARCSG